MSARTTPDSSYVLVICTGNTCRSPMAQALLGRSLQESGIYVNVKSAGTEAEAGAPASADAVKLLERKGIDLTTHSASPLTAEIVAGALAIFCMTPRHVDAVRALSGAQQCVELFDPTGIADPFDLGAMAYEECVRSLERALPSVTARIAAIAADPYIRSSGHLSVGDGHVMFWEDWGNAARPPILFLHGGPGSGCKRSHKDLFDPERHRVIFHDQRGSGRSEPSASTEANTTQHLLADVTRLAEHLELERVSLAGGSWGSTLALLWARAFPSRVDRMLLWSIYLARKEEDDYVNEGHARRYFPEAWARFIALVPPEHRGTGDEIMAYYAAQMSSDDERGKRFADEWTLWETALFSPEPDPYVLTREVLGENNRALARLEAHYFTNGCFIADDPILARLDAIRHIPCFAIHARRDMCTPASAAVDLASAYGSRMTLHWVNASHWSADPPMRTAIQTATRAFLV